MAPRLPQHDTPAPSLDQPGTFGQSRGEVGHDQARHASEVSAQHSKAADVAQRTVDGASGGVPKSLGER